MFQELLRDARLFLALLQFDADLAEEAGAAACPSCGGPMHKAPFPRKPRGIPKELHDAYARRFSFCCGNEGCRKRLTPPSLRFLGRRIYVGAMVVLVAAMRHGPNKRRLRELKELFGIDARTVQRWCRFWREIFRESPFWKAARARFVPAADEAALPMSIFEQIAGDLFERVVKFLRFLAPITRPLGLTRHDL